MNVTVWGTRGSVPVSSPETTRFGGNTACIEIVTDAGDRLILDAGTGIRALGQAMRRAAVSGEPGCTLCFTHTHWDHLQGLPFFSPMYDPGWSVSIRGPLFPGQSGVKTSLEQIFNGRNFPLELDHTCCRMDIADFIPGDSFQIGTALVETCPTRHPGGCVAYRITADGWSFVFTGDHESCRSDDEVCPDCERLARFVAGADVLLADGQYTAAEYDSYRGWGHSCIEYWPEIAARAGIRHLVFTHHDPRRTDEEIDALGENLTRQFAHLPVRMDFAYEGMRIQGKSDTFAPPETDRSLRCWLCDLGNEFSRYTDVGMILDSILTEARAVSHADAGTVYLVEDDSLVFAYAQNQTLFPGAAALRLMYLNARIPLNAHSIAGYVAVTREPLSIDDVRHLPPGAPYRFNEAMDISSGYRTVSMFTLPLMLKGRLLGVLQLINRLNAESTPVPFTAETRNRIVCMAEVAGASLERGVMANELILRMLEMAALRDPAETAGHVRRVGAMAAEIYHQWAERHQADLQELRRVKDHIRLAAMLHDVGKVGIPDAVLKKPGALTPEERAIVEQHCALGARLFSNIDWAVDAMAYEIALHHHQRWDGAGYTGSPAFPLLAGEDIPLHARITAIADVYDALVSPRCYKEPFPQSVALDIIAKGRGTQFDPEVVDAFMEIIDMVDAIIVRYPEKDVCLLSNESSQPS